MPTVEELNRTWEAHLTSFDAETWRRMRTVGVTAAWEASSNPPANAMATLKGPSCFEFVVRFRGNELVRESSCAELENTLAAESIFRAARMLELLGVPVIPS